MAESATTQADRLAARARRLASTDLDKAIKLQRDAVSGYRAVFEDARRATEAGVHSAGVATAAHRVSEALGRLGGLLRRNGELDAAIDAYGEGKELEEDFDLADSYCLGNWIALRWLRDDEDEAKLVRDTEEALERVDLQVEGERRDQWWAWADLGMLSLLAGRDDVADRAYVRFADHGARRADFDSTMAVLTELRDKLVTVRPSVAEGIDRALRQLAEQRERS